MISSLKRFQKDLKNSNVYPSGPELLLPSQDQIASFTSTLENGQSNSNLSGSDNKGKSNTIGFGLHPSFSLKKSLKCSKIKSLTSSTSSNLPLLDSREHKDL